MRRLTFALLFILLTCFCAGASAENWVDDWFDNAIATGSGPGMVKGSARKYYSAGYGSIRWKTAVDYPISIGLPSVRFGCGGVDIFLGSMDLMNFDYLVSRMKNIMYTAGAFAFQYALSRLNPKANQIIQALDSAANFLNQLQLDECRAGKAVAAVVMSPFSKEAADDMGTLVAETKQALGIKGSWTEIVDSWKKDLTSGKTSSKIKPDEQSQIENGCPDEMNSFISTVSTDGIAKWLAQKGVITADFVPVIRGIAGDVTVSKAGEAFLISPCRQDFADIVEALLRGQLNQCTDVGGLRCTCAVFEQGKEITKKVRQRIADYLSKLPQRPKNLSDNDLVVFLNAIHRYPVYDVLKMAYQSGVSSSTVSEDSAVVKCAAYFYGTGLLANALSEAIKVEKMIDQWKAWCSNSSDVGRCKYCGSGIMQSLDKTIHRYTQKLRTILYDQLEVQNLASRSEACLQLEKNMTVLNRLSEIEQKYSLPARLK